MMIFDSKTCASMFASRFQTGEVVETHDCVDSRAEESQTSYWNKYY